MRLLAFAFVLSLPLLADAPKEGLSFEMREIDKALDIGYAVLLADIDGDRKTDIVVVDTHRVVWYQNPTWKKRTILEGKTARDNVCLSAADIDGDGKLDLAIGAGWRPADTKGGGTLQWLKQPDDLDKEWKMYPIADEPTLHRIRFCDLDGTGKPVLIVGPLFGRNSTRAKNWMDAPLRVLAFRVPKDPTRDRWPMEVIDESLHVMHNFHPIPAKKGMDLLTASYEGVHRLSRDGGKWRKTKLNDGNQATPKGSRGASEIRTGKLKGGTELIGTIEPWHGHQVVVYTPPKKGGTEWDRHVIDEDLKWGHAVWFADLDGDGSDELIIGVRDDLAKEAGKRRGVRIYKATDATGTKWKRQLVDEGGVAVEDLACADLDGDGKVDIVAVGRQTKNVRVYRNVGKK